MEYSRIAGTGAYLPAKTLTNQEIEQRIETSDEWIFSRTGIRSRFVADEKEQASDLALHASRRAMDAAGVTADDVDLIVLATSTPDMIFPSTACLLQQKLGVTHGAAFDIQAACTGFLYAVSIADKFVASGQCKCALVVGTEVFSRLLDWSDRRTCVLFGDGAGAVILRQSEQPGILSSHLHADGRQSHILEASGYVQDGVLHDHAFLHMDGQAVFKFAVRALEDVCNEALAANGLVGSDLDWLVPHQANIRIIQATANKLGLPTDKIVTTLETQGNTSAASVPLALDAAVRDGRIQPGHLVLLEAVGAGMTWGAMLLRW